MKSESRLEPGEGVDFCANSLCPLNRIKAGVAVRIKKLCASPQVSTRLRELGFCEEQVIRLLTAHSNIICMVCDARLALSTQIAETIMVEPVYARAA